MLKAAELHDMQFSSHAENRMSSVNENFNNVKQFTNKDSGFDTLVWKTPVLSIIHITAIRDPSNTLLCG